ncbi:MAG TPA: hypothetical protein VFY92_01955 [Hyphomicrobiaceae bacterium]|nr:hypothetical protein [Hyphomicrobiaceae bacterium]
MAFENTKAEIALLMGALQDPPRDKHELYLEIIQKLNELRAYGMPLPDDLVELEHQLEREFAAEQHSQQVAQRKREQAAGTTQKKP